MLKIRIFKPMQEELNLAIVQAELAWENPEENKARFEDLIGSTRNDVDLFVLPEMFLSGFTMHPERVAESMDGRGVAWMKDMAQSKNAALCGSLVIKGENKRFYNRLIFAYPNGDIKTYDKRHTFTLAGEDKVYTAGSEKLLLTYKGWKICPLICYDLRFPVWARNVEDYDLLLYVANWPVQRIKAWDSLLQARAIENMAYSVGVNRVGLDANKYEYNGHSAVYDVLGNCLGMAQEKMETVLEVQLTRAHIENYRKKLQFLEDRDQFTIH